MKYTNIDFKIDDVIFHGNIEDNCLFIDWIILYECNYKCSYCFGQDSLSKDKFTHLEKLKYAVDQIFTIDKDRYAFTLTGGEVTYYPYLLDLIDYIFSYKNKNISIYIITNGSKNIDFFNNFFSKYAGYDITFTISIHFEYVQFDHIFDIIKLANQYNKRIRISIMAHPIMRKEVESFFNDILKLRNNYVFDINLATIMSGESYNILDPRYDEDYLKWIKESTEYINNKVYKNDNLNRITWGPKYYYNLKNGQNNIRIGLDDAIIEEKLNFNNFYCCGGINTIRINHDGTYKSGTCSNYEIIGNIYTDVIDYKKLLNIVKCSLNSCPCTADYAIPKFRYIENAIEYNDKIKNNYLFSVLNSINNKFNILNNDIRIIKYKTNSIIDTLAWWIPFKKQRESFRSKFKVRPDQTRPDQTRPDLIICKEYIQFYNNSKNVA